MKLNLSKEALAQSKKELSEIIVAKIMCSMCNDNALGKLFVEEAKDCEDIPEGIDIIKYLNGEDADEYDEDEVDDSKVYDAFIKYY